MLLFAIPAAGARGGRDAVVHVDARLLPAKDQPVDPSPEDRAAALRHECDRGESYSCEEHLPLCRA